MSATIKLYSIALIMRRLIHWCILVPIGVPLIIISGPFADVFAWQQGGRWVNITWWALRSACRNPQPPTA